MRKITNRNKREKKQVKTPETYQFRVFIPEKRRKKAPDGLSSFCFNLTLHILELPHFPYAPGNYFTQIKHKRCKEHIHF